MRDFGRVVRQCCALMGACLATLPGEASAQVITFDPAQSYVTVSGTFSLDGYKFVNSQGAYNEFLFWNAGNPFNSDPTGGTLGVNYENTSTTVSKVDGGTFTLHSIDLADLYNMNYGPSHGGHVLFTFTTASGSSNQTVLVDDSPGMQTFSFEVSDLISFTYAAQDTYGNYLQVDNIAVDEPRSEAVANSNAVPEPLTWSLMVGGFGAIGAAMRRQKASNVAVA